MFTPFTLNFLKSNLTRLKKLLYFGLSEIFCTQASNMTDPAVAATVVLIFTLISAGMFIYQFYFFSGFHKPTGDVYCLPLKGFVSGQVNQFCTASAFGNLLEANPQLILLEPDYLVSLYLLQSALKQTEADWVPLQLSDWLSAAKKKDEQVLADWKDLQWRFDLPADGFGSSTHSLTVGLIASQDNSDLFKSLKSLGGFTLFEEVSGVVHHDNSNSSSNSSTQPLHYFLINKDHQHLTGGNLQSKKGNSSSPPPLPLFLHIVVLHRVAEFLWVGGVPAETRQKLQQQLISTENSSFSLPYVHFGAEYEQIYDPFSAVPSSADGHFLVSVPDDITHLLSQLPTARYQYCPLKRGEAWFAETGLPPNEHYERVSVLAYRDLKALARHLRMEVWITAGTLLGWYRQCTVTPFTTDTDFASWAKYAQATSFNASTTFLEALQELEESGSGNKLALLRRLGEPSATLEYTFLFAGRESVDLFFAYSNGSHLMTPLHALSQGMYTYNVYPPFRLCSVAMLGVKLLAPCDPEAVITTEYGSTWRKPIAAYHYLDGPLNTDPLRAYNFSGPQQVKYSGKPPKKVKKTLGLIF